MKIFILVFCCLIAFAAFWYGIKLIRLYFRVKNWDRVIAKIIKKEVVKRKTASASRAGYKPAIEYSYLVNLKEYHGNRVFLVELMKGERGFLQVAAERFLEKIKPEAEIYVDPERPEQAVLFCDGLMLYILVLLMGIMSLLLGIANFIS